MKRNTLIFLSLSLGIFVASCNRDKKAPVITFIEPAENAVFHDTDAVSLKVHVTDNDQIEEVDMHVVNLQTKDTIFHNHQLTTLDVFDVSGTWFPTPADTGNFSEYIEASDAAGNEAEAERRFKVIK